MVRLFPLPMIEHCTAIILVGGESKRMGSDKATIKLHGKPMLEHVLEQISPLFSGVLISVNTLREDIKLPQIVDHAEGRGPILGIKRALEEVRTDWVFVIACDMPFVSVRLIQELSRHRKSHDAVVTFAFDRAQPLFGFYNKTCLPNIETRIQQGQRSMIRLLDELNTYYMSEQQVALIDPELKSLLSLDTQDDVNKMESIT